MNFDRKRSVSKEPHKFDFHHQYTGDYTLYSVLVKISSRRFHSSMHRRFERRSSRNLKKKFQSLW